MIISKLHAEYLIILKSTKTACALLEKQTSLLALKFAFVTDTNISGVLTDRQECVSI
jgi:hypothetical protein